MIGEVFYIISRCFVFSQTRRRNSSFHNKRTRYTGNACILLGAIYENFHLRLNVICNTFQSDMRNKSTYFFAFFVLLSFVDITARRSHVQVFQIIPRKSSRKNSLSGKCQRNATNVTGNPTSTHCSATYSISLDKTLHAKPPRR